MKRLTTPIKVLVASSVIAMLFYLFHPSVIKQGWANRDLKTTLNNHRKEALKWSNVKRQIAEVNMTIDLAVKNRPFQEWGFQYFIRAPFTEEMVFRGLFVLIPVLLLPEKKMFLKINWTTVLLWLIMFVGSYVWTDSHNYPLFPQAVIMSGGLINGSCIIHTHHNMAAKAKGMLLAILFHLLANVFYLGIFHFIIP